MALQGESRWVVPLSPMAKKARIPLQYILEEGMVDGGGPKDCRQ